MYKVNEIIIIVENKFGNLRGIYSSKEVLHQLIFFPFQNNVKYRSFSNKLLKLNTTLKGWTS